MRHLVLIVLTAAATIANAQPLATGQATRYDAHRLVSVELHTAGDASAMDAIGADRWSHHVRVGSPTDFLVTPEQFAALDATGLVYEVRIEDIQAQIDAETARLAEGGARGWFDDFKDLAAINDYLDVLVAFRPDIASTFDVGQTIEGRTVRALRISNDTFGDPGCKPAILFNACQHAREWIAPMVAMYTAEQLISLYGTDPDVTALVDRTEFIIIPVVNPDGYSYTWTTQRLWRKNRRDNEDGSYGVDLNRNWGYEWGHNNGSSGSTGSATYRGTAPFSEPETQIVRDLALSLPRLAAQVDLHSYGQYILAPWGWTSTPPPGHETFQLLGAEIQQIILSVNGRNYRQGQMYQTLYPISGGEGDWFWGDQTVHNFLIELRGTSFVLPPEQIIPNGEEVFPALLHFADWARLERNSPADFNDDAAIDSLDVIAFLNAWAAGEGSADIDGNGVVDTRDVIAFLNFWAAGC